MENDELLDREETCEFLGGKKRPIDSSTLYRGIKDGRYSAPIKMGPATSRWRKSDLQADIERAAAQRDAPEAPKPQPIKPAVIKSKRTKRRTA